MSRKPPAMVLFPSRNDEDAPGPSRRPKKKRYTTKPQSIVERFDKMANAHLDEHDGGCSSTDEDDKLLSGPVENRRPVKSVSRNLAGSITGFDIAESVGVQHDNELAEAVEKLIKAEETTRFTELVVAAEAAVAAAPPDLAEEAALAVAHEYQTQNLSMIQEEIPGETIIEVIGYVGIRRRKDNADKRSCVC